MAQHPTDLTHADWAANAHPNDEGTAIYWLVDPDGNFEQMFVPSVTLSRARDLATQLMTMQNWKLDAFRWVPDHVENVTSLVRRRCGGRCQGDLDCVNNSCRCIHGRCRRK